VGERAAVQLVLQHVGDTAEIVRGIPGHYAWRRLEHDLKAHVSAIDRFKILLRQRPAGRLQERTHPSCVRVARSEDRHGSVLDRRRAVYREGDQTARLG
jgi:hypothetical protein